MAWLERKARKYADHAAEARAKGDLAQAETDYLRALAWKPKDSSLRSLLGQTYYELGRTEDAKVQFKKALELNYNDQSALRGLAIVLQQQGNASDAMYYYRRYLELNPKDGSVLLNLGTIFHTMGDFQRAIEYYRQAEESGTDQALVSRNHALALFSLGRIEEAASLLQQALSANPQDAELHRLLGQALETTGDLQRASSNYERAVQLNPQDPNARASWALMLYRDGRLQEGLEHMQLAEELYEKAGDQKAAAFACWNIGWIHYQMHDYEPSARACSKALSLNPDLVGVHFSLGLVLLHLGNITEARSQYEQGVASSQVSDLENYAIRDLEAAMQIRPELPGAAEILKNLQDHSASVQKQYLSPSQTKST